MNQPMELKQSEFEVILESLEHLQDVLNDVNYDSDVSNPQNVKQTAPYAVGYSKETISSLIETLKAIQSFN
tara:strand:- start:904 stop:1116 length:213 start_codon:yes stop_codon:yes gene_type:complete